MTFDPATYRVTAERIHKDLELLCEKYGVPDLAPALLGEAAALAVVMGLPKEKFVSGASRAWELMSAKAKAGML